MLYGKHKIYLDHAATTAMKPEVLEEMKPYLTQQYGNPSAAYKLGEISDKAIRKAREEIAQTIQAKPEEIFFTSGGSESDNWALKGACDYAAFHNLHQKKMHIITSEIEHHAVLKTTAYLSKKGVEVSLLKPDVNGVIAASQLSKTIKNNTILISVMYANNEIGTIEPIKEIGEYAGKRDILFHTDAVQAFGQLPINVKEENIDLLSASGHKLGGPKGIGFLYIKKGEKMEPFIHGGGQENNMRAGTENVASIVGLGAAAKIARQNMERRTEKLLTLRNYLSNYLLENVPQCRINGADCDTVEEWRRTRHLHRLPGNLNLSIWGISGAELIARLDEAGICASTASACSKHTKASSHVLLSIGLSEEAAGATIRLTLGAENTMMQMQYVAQQIVRIVKGMRS